ncbi:RcnB family protein [Xylophilus sp. GOD-11R]|uniref:RcnB family protein n=1 Tax=Xylophilus sp. GOD-11R TaxID=3089814 RepID=UPI00298D3178|nr:RcnB family protein [Xylophilus sp. GOD-11R]WPB58799.1 RcnB family protein [Xylophilus sp. GOD-11R]
MQSKKIGAAFLAFTLGVSSLAFAQPREGRDDHRGGPEQQQRGNGHGPDRGGPGHDRHADARGAGPDHRFHRGDRLPAEYRSRQYVVDDWRGHRLSAPPRGYQWVQVGGDYVLAAIATGVIASLFLNQ